jgi:hypothetical protein
MNNFKATVLSLSAVTAIALSGCGSSDSGTTTTPTADLTLVKTAYDYFIKDANTTNIVASSGTIEYDNAASPVGVDETIVWKGKAGDNKPLEDYTFTTSYSSTCTVKNIDENLSSTISVNTDLNASKVYGINGKVNVTSGAILTIPAGTTLVGVTPDSGAQIIADGNLTAPITFTSYADSQCNSADNKAGEWGGLVLAGTAYTHYVDNTYEADPTVNFGSTTHNDDNTSSGILDYVVIKHSGYQVQVDKELNGLSLAGVGSGTTLTNIAIIGGLDDGLEIWGGTPNIDGLYVYNAQDDSVDTDLGYRGTIQNVLVRQVNVDKTNNHDSSAMEFGNDNNTILTDDTNATQPYIINFTAYVKGGGFYNKYDAGFKWDNVKFVSDKTTDYELVHFRGADSYDTGAKHILGPVNFSNTASITLDENNTYSKQNSKAQ